MRSRDALIHRIAQMASPKALAQAYDHIYEETTSARENGHVLACENHDLKALGHSNIDHHNNEAPLYESGWGLYCASLLVALAIMADLTYDLKGYPEEKPDKDQELALDLLALPSPEYVEAVLEERMKELLMEEFAISCRGHKPKHVNIDKMPPLSAQLYWGSDEDTPPLAIIQHEVNKLPIEGGYWNHVTAQVVRHMLAEVNQEQVLETGVDTLVIHGNKLSKPDWQIVKPDRLVLGMVAVNPFDWSDQYEVCEKTITQHERLTYLLHEMYPLKICRNLLAIVQQAPRYVPDHAKKHSKQYGLEQLLEELLLMGYLPVENGEALFRNF